MEAKISQSAKVKQLVVWPWAHVARAVTQNARVALASALAGAALCWTLLSFIPWHPLQVLKHIAAFPNCSAARAVGVAPSYRGQPGYWFKLDADNDGTLARLATTLK